MQELEHRRGPCSKVFDLGGGRQRVEIARHPIHYEKDGKLLDIDLTPRIGKHGDYELLDCPYSLRIAKDAPVYIYNSLSGKRVSVELLAGNVGAPLVDGGLFKWAEIAKTTDYIINPLPKGCSTLLVLYTPEAPRKWSWRILGDLSLIAPLTGLDSGGRRLELVERRDAATGVIEVEWTGRTIDPLALRRKDGRRWTDDVTWPVLIDPTVNENIGAGADDVFSFWSGSSGTNFNNFDAGSALLAAGRYRSSSVVGSLFAGLRFQTVGIPAGSTINSATLTVRITAVSGGGADINIYGNDVDSAGAWSNPGNRVKNITKTSAVVNKASWTSGADNAISVTTIVAEIVARGGWVSNNHMAFGFFNNVVSVGSSRIINIAAFEHASLTEARLAIDYTAGGGGATPRSRGFIFG